MFGLGAPDSPRRPPRGATPAGPAPAASAPRARAWDRHLGAVDHDAIWPLQARADAPERQGGIEQHEVGVDARRQLVHLAGQPPRPGSITLRPTRSMRIGCAASNAYVPSNAVVRTVVSSGGSRRHSSHRYDWMPPTFGGKSLVTSRWLKGRQPRRSRSGACRRCRVPLQHLVVEGDVTLDDRHHVPIGDVAHVAQRDQCVAAEVAGIPPWDVPAAVPGEQLRIVGFEQLHEVDPRVPTVYAERDRDPSEPPVRRADLLTDVASVDPIAERLPELAPENRPAAAPARRGTRRGSTTPWAMIAPRRAAVDATAAPAATIGLRGLLGDREARR